MTKLTCTCMASKTNLKLGTCIPERQPLNAYEVKKKLPPCLQIHQNASCIGVQHSQRLDTCTFHLKLWNKNPSKSKLNSIQYCKKFWTWACNHTNRGSCWRGCLLLAHEHGGKQSITYHLYIFGAINSNFEFLRRLKNVLTTKM